MMGSFIKISLWMSFSISLPHISSIFVSFYAFLYFIHKFLPRLKKPRCRSRIVVMFWSKLYFMFGYSDLEIFEFVLENTLKTP